MDLELREERTYPTQNWFGAEVSSSPDEVPSLELMQEDFTMSWQKERWKVGAAKSCCMRQPTGVSDSVR